MQQGFFNEPQTLLHMQQGLFNRPQGLLNRPQGLINRAQRLPNKPQGLFNAPQVLLADINNATWHPNIKCQLMEFDYWEFHRVGFEY